MNTLAALIVATLLAGPTAASHAGPADGLHPASARPPVVATAPAPAQPPAVIPLPAK